ncbi:hypothetical protein [Mesoterricola sediminis]|uniref:Uncharacterized protein n=1 Tax=Mesoterricola sediminis TaxID=2927980 RepID=A0AA48KE24_9BACT|nr:hypothetical protein [Mesoterricola sediminis]BDU78816.1 hypothetical protein METESE_37740 [Mesoterricola sediminis]
MSEPGVPILLSLPEPDRPHFRNLALIRPQLPTERQLELVENLARTLASPHLLALIARTPHWLVHPPVLHGLAANEATPEGLRRDLEMAVSLFDLMREMDRAPEGEKAERAEAVKALYQELPGELRPVVKQMAKHMARSVHATGTTLELPPLPSGDPDWEALLRLPPAPGPVRPAYRMSSADRTAQAESTLVQEDLGRFLADEESRVRIAALRNPALSEDTLHGALEAAQAPGLFEEIYQEARWYFKESIREALWTSPFCPGELARRMGATRDLILALERGAAAPGGLDRRRLRRVVSLFTQAEESEYQYLTWWAKRKAPTMLRVIKVFFDRLQRRRATQASGLSPSQAEGRWVSLEERVFLANQATQPEQIQAALRDPDPQVFQVALENPGLAPRDLLPAIPALDGHRAERLAANRTWSAHPAVKEALLHNPHLSEPTALTLLAGLDGPPRLLLDLLRDQRLPHLAVKRLAQERLRAAYEGMDVPQRILALRHSGGELIRHLPAEVFRDEEVLRLLVSDRQVDPAILLRLARNKQTPREVLERIAGHPALMAHPAVMSELLLNPKTPREAARRIWTFLSPSEQQQLLRSPHLPMALRALGQLSPGPAQP